MLYMHELPQDSQLDILVHKLVELFDFYPLTEDEQITFVQYIVARYGANVVELSHAGLEYELGVHMKWC